MAAFNAYLYPRLYASSPVIIRLHDVSVHLLSPHSDVRASHRICGQLIIDHFVFVHTVPVGPFEVEEGHWRLHFDSIIPPGAYSWSIAILYEKYPHVTRLLGVINMGRSEVLEEAGDEDTADLIELSFPIDMVDDDAPSLEISAILSLSAFQYPPELATSATNPSELITDFDGPDELSLEPRAVLSTVEGMYTTAKSIDSLIISVAHQGILLFPSDDGTRAYLLSILGDVCSSISESKDAENLNRTVAIYDDALREAKRRTDPNPTHYASLGMCLQQRFEKLGNIEDLQRSVEMFEEVLSLVSDTDADKPSYLNNLGSALRCRFEHLGNLPDLDRSILTKEQAVRLATNEHPDKPALLRNLATSFLARFERLGDVRDLDRAVELTQEAVKTTSHEHPDMPSWLNSLGAVLIRSYKSSGDLKTLQRSIEACEEAHHLLIEGHPDKPCSLINLGTALQCRFQRLGEPADIRRSIQLFEDAILLVPDKSPDKHAWANNLGAALVLSFENFGNIEDLDKSIKWNEVAILLTANTHPDRLSRLNNLGNSLLRRFERLGDAADLDKAVSYMEEAVQRIPDDHPDKLVFLNNLGHALLCRFEKVGDLDDLNRSIEFGNEAVRRCPYDQPDKASWLVNLGNSFLRRFERLGDFEDLHCSIFMQGRALELTSDDHPKKPSYLHNRSNSLMRRFEEFGALADIHQSVSSKTEALELLPKNHPDRPVYLNSLGVALLYRFERLGDDSDLDKSIRLKEQALRCVIDGHIARNTFLNSLGTSLMRRFEQHGNLSDLNGAVEAFEGAVLQLSEKHPNRSSWLNNLGGSLACRFNRLGDPSDLDRSISYLQQAVASSSADNPQILSFLNNLGTFLIRRFKKSKNEDDFLEANLQSSTAAKSTTGPTHLKFLAARRWLKYALLHRPDEAFEAGSITINLIPRLAWLGSSIPDRHHRIQKAGRAARDAAAAAIAVGNYRTAVEWLEQGRSVIWNQLLQLGSPVYDLEDVHPKLARELRSLSARLERSANPNYVEDNSKRVVASTDYHSLAFQREQLLKKIREQSGFEDFLLPKTLPELLHTVKHGPVVILNTSKSRCDALVLIPEIDDPRHIPLQDLTLEKAQGWYDRIQTVLKGGGRYFSENKDRLEAEDVEPNIAAARRSASEDACLASVFEEIWHVVVHPILENLEITTPMGSELDIRRIWWCPTGPLALIPIHAAGIYPSGPKLRDFVISSYAPTLTALLHPEQVTSHEPRQILLVSLPIQSRLPGTKREVQSIAEHAADSNNLIVKLTESEATPVRVAQAMKQCNWAHFACHGSQKIDDPTNSCLLLAGYSPLMLSEIVHLRLEKPELAFLSACRTATGTQKLPDEAVHIAGGMLLAGYQGVIATMWKIDDDVAADVAGEVYRLLIKEYGGDFRRSAEALHFAIQNVWADKERKGYVSLSNWVPFIHLGV